MLNKKYMAWEYIISIQQRMHSFRKYNVNHTEQSLCCKIYMNKLNSAGSIYLLEP